MLSGTSHWSNLKSDLSLLPTNRLLLTVYCLAPIEFWQVRNTLPEKPKLCPLPTAYCLLLTASRLPPTAFAYYCQLSMRDYCITFPLLSRTTILLSPVEFAVFTESSLDVGSNVRAAGNISNK